MRLTPIELQTLRTVLAAIDRSARLYLFGSRANDDAKGGDIDLLIHSSTMTQNDVRQMRWQLLEQLGEQKIDITLSATLRSLLYRWC